MEFLSSNDWLLGWVAGGNANPPDHVSGWLLYRQSKLTWWGKKNLFSKLTFITSLLWFSSNITRFVLILNDTASSLEINKIWSNPNILISVSGWFLLNNRKCGSSGNLFFICFLIYILSLKKIDFLKWVIINLWGYCSCLTLLLFKNTSVYPRRVEVCHGEGAGMVGWGAAVVCRCNGIRPSTIQLEERGGQAWDQLSVAPLSGLKNICAPQKHFTAFFFFLQVGKEPAQFRLTTRPDWWMVQKCVVKFRL